ncbi:MAG TPA: monovalent cation/H+ antiporter complex subunit F [Microthrixaceae bacterium]|nr:monovalent cation/H+ antiporter complex subunit F [Microthrixaceae bacterium]
MIVATNVAFGLLTVGLALALVRLLRGPSIADRVVATDLFLTFLVMGAGVLSVRSGEGAYLEVMLVVAVVGFLGTAMVARFIERRGA